MFLPNPLDDQRATHLRVSPLYNTVEQLIKTKSPNLASVKCEKVARFNKKVIYLHFPSKPISVAFEEGYVFKERHLTIHQYYKNKEVSHGLSIAHYTEVYNNPVTNKQRVVHFYFNSKNELLYPEVKEYVSGREGGFDKIAMRQEVRDFLKEDRQEVVLLLNKLLMATQSLYQQASEEANKLEKELQEITTNLSPDSIVRYLKVAKQFIEAVNKINSYTEKDFDTRNKIVAGHITHLEGVLANFNKSETVTDHEGQADNLENTSQGENPVSIAKDPKTKVKEKLDKLFLEGTTLRSRYTELNEKIRTGNKDVSLLIQREEMYDHLKIFLFELSLHTPICTKNQKETIKKLSNNLTKSEGLVDIFKKEIWLGNLSFVKELYPYVKRNLDLTFWIGIITDLVKEHIPRTTDEEDRLRAVFNFLQDESEIYRFVLQGCGTFLIGNEKGDKFLSFLVIAYLADNFFAYSLLLSHGVKINGYGMIINDYEIPAIFVIAGVKDLNFKKRYLDLVRNEIDFNFKVQRIDTSEELGEWSKKLGRKNRELLLASRRFFNAAQNNEAVFYGFAREQTLIEFCARGSHLAEIEYFLPHMGIEHVLAALSIIIQQKQTFLRYVLPARSHGFDLCHSNYLAIKSFLLYELESEDQKYFTVLWYTEDTERLRLVEKLYQLFLGKFKTLKKHSPQLLSSVYDRLYASADSLRRAKQFSHNIWQFDACILYLLCETPSPHIYQRLMKIICEQALEIKQSSPAGPPPKRYYALYRLASWLAETTSFAKELQTTPLYAHVLAVNGSDESKKHDESVIKFQIN